MEQNTIFRLADAWYAGGRGTAMEIAEELLRPVAKCKRLPGGLTATLKGKTDYTILLDAHIDEIALFVTSVQGGFVKVAAAGGFDSRMLPATPVVIHGKQEITGVFCSTPPHLLQGKSSVQKVEDMYIDTLLEDAAELVRVGDPVTFATKAKALHFGAFTGKALDDRVACIALIETAQRLASAELPCNVCISLSDAEEIGSRGARVNAFSVMPDEAVAIDVSFASGPDIPEEKSGKPGAGVMLGISPVLDRRVTDTLRSLCEREQIAYQPEVIGAATSTDADVITLTGGGVPTGLCSIPLRNMHTTVETVWLSDVEETVRLLTAYCLNGGALHA